LYLPPSSLNLEDFFPEVTPAGVSNKSVSLPESLALGLGLGLRLDST